MKAFCVVKFEDDTHSVISSMWITKKKTVKILLDLHQTILKNIEAYP